MWTLLAVASAGALASSCLGQSWNSLRNDYRVQENEGFAQMYVEDGQLAYMPDFTAGYWNVSYYAWNPNSRSVLYSVGDQMQPSAYVPNWDSPAQSAVCRWTAPVDAAVRVRWTMHKDSQAGFGSDVTILAGGETKATLPIEPWDLSEKHGSFDVTLAAGDAVLVRIDPRDRTATSGDAIDFELAIFGPCQADLNHDGLVDDADFVAFVFHYDRLVSVGADFNDDGLTEDSDFVTFCGAYDALLCD